MRGDRRRTTWFRAPPPASTAAPGRERRTRASTCRNRSGRRAKADAVDGAGAAGSSSPCRAVRRAQPLHPLHPAVHAEDAVGAWRGVHRRREAVTRARLPADMLERLRALARVAHPRDRRPAALLRLRGGWWLPREARGRRGSLLLRRRAQRVDVALSQPPCRADRDRDRPGRARCRRSGAGYRKRNKPLNWVLSPGPRSAAANRRISRAWRNA